MTEISTNSTFRTLVGLNPHCSVDRCFGASAVAMTQTHPLWASPLRANLCVKHERAFVKEAAAAGVTVTVDQRF